MEQTQTRFDTTPKPLPFWKQYWYVVLFVVAILLIILSVILRLLTPPAADQDNTWNGITPGITTEKEIKAKLGEPVKTSQTEDGKVLEYKPDYQTRINNQVIVDQSGKVQFVREYYNPTSKETIDQYIEKYGQPDLKLYDPTIGAVNAYVFLKVGVVMIAHVNGGIVEQKWNFVPTTAEKFSASWGKTLSPQSMGPESLGGE